MKAGKGRGNTANSDFQAKVNDEGCSYEVECLAPENLDVVVLVTCLRFHNALSDFCYAF